MFFCVVLVAASCWMGFETVLFLVGKWFDLVTVAGFGMPIGIIVMGWMFFISNVYFEFSFILGLFWITVITSISAFLRFFNMKKTKRKMLVDSYGWWVCVVIPSLFLGYWVFTSILYKGQIVRHSVYGDLPFHLNIISSFVYGCNKNRKSLFDVVSPFYSGVPLAYPLIVDFISSVMVACFDTGMQWALVIPSLPMVVSIFIVLNRIARTFSNDKVMQTLVPWLFLFIGGNGWSVAFNWKLFQDFRADLVHGWGNDKNYFWFHCIHHILLPQRLSLFAIPICWSYICLLLNNHSKRQIFFLCGIIVGILPQVQGHALIALFEFTLGYGLLHFPWRSYRKMVKEVKNYIILGVPALVLAVPQLSPFVARVTRNSFIKAQPIWTELKLNPLEFWWKGLGFFWVLSMCHCWLVMNGKQIRFYLSSMPLFLLSTLITYQPWYMDNTKVFYDGWVPLAVVVVGLFLSYLFHMRTSLSSFLGVAFLLCCTVSSVIGLIHCGRLISPLWNNEAEVLETAEWAKDNTEPNSVWLIEFTTHHPVPCLAGRQAFLTYSGWAVNHLLPWEERTLVVTEFSRNVNDTSPLDRYNIEYICFEKGGDSLPFSLEGSTAWTKLFSNNIYDIWGKYHAID